MSKRLVSRSLAPLALALAAGLASCGDSDEGEGALVAVLAPGEIPPETTPLETLPRAPLFANRPVAVRPAIRDNLPHSDPTTNGWPTETWAREAELLLEDTFAVALRGQELPAQRVSERFRGASALAGDWRALDQHGEVQVEPGTGPDSWPEGHGEPLEPDLAAQLRKGAEQLGTLREVRVDVVRMRPVEPDGADSRFRVLIAWDRDGGVVQYNGAWSVQFQRTPQGLAIEELRRHGSELVTSAAPILSDVTGFAFGQSECFPDEYLRDPEAYYFHADRLSEYDIWGNYGMAVGDVDGDGWEDVYSCTAAGMPNRLFLRNPDGTTREASAEWNVGFLDPTRSAVIVDLDGDGLRDLACAVGSNVVIAWNDGKRFSERTILNSPGTEDVYGISCVDADGDGDVDLFACCYGVGVVREGTRGPARVMRTVPTPFYDAFNGASNVYWRNEGSRVLVDATSESGLDQNNSKFSFSSIWEDLDGDGDPDLYVANDFGRNHLYRNDGGHFVDVATECGADDQASGMGPTCGDFDLDGDMDIYISNVYAPEGLRITDWAEQLGTGETGAALLHSSRLARGNTLLRNKGDGTFEDVSEALGANRGGWGWGARFLDLDNDLYEDLYAPNGWFTKEGTQDINDFFWRFVVARSPAAGKPSPEYSIAMTTIEHLALETGHTWAGDEHNLVLMNQGGERFVDASALVSPDRPMDARAAAGIDWDRDGSIDLVLKNRNGPRLQLLHNRSPRAASNGWLVLELENQAPNRDAIGAHIEVHVGGKVLRRTIYAGDGFISQTPRRQHFGLADHAAVDLVLVRWPDGQVERHESGIAPNGAYVIVRGEAEPRPLPWEPVAGVREQAHAPLAALAGPLERVILFDEIPMAPVPLPSFTDHDRTVSEFGGAPLLLTLWSNEDELAVGQLRRLARGREALAAAGIAAVPVTIDEGPGLVGARRTAEGLGFGVSGGYADGRLLLAYEVLLSDVLPRTGNNLMPCNLLLDSGGRLCVVYQGPVQVEQVLADAARLEARGEASAGETLTGGLWIQRPSRNFAELSKTLGELGRSELAEFYGELRAPAAH